MKRAPVAALVLAVTLVGCRTTAPPAREFFASPDPARRALPFSEAVRAGDLLLLSGQIGNLPGTLQLAPGGIAAEAEQVLANVREILGRHGATMDDVVKCTVFLADIRDWPAFNEIYRKSFASHYPARSALGADGLALGARVELECVAYLPVGREPAPGPATSH